MDPDGRSEDGNQQHGQDQAPGNQTLADKGDRGDTHADGVEQECRRHRRVQFDIQCKEDRNQDKGRSDASH
jgi:hypothetical protein